MKACRENSVATSSYRCEAEAWELKVGSRLISVDRQSSGECPLPPISVVPAGHRPHGRSAQLATARHPAHWVLAGMFATGLGSDFCLLRDFQSIIDLNA
jgi:hypothetical protein